MISSKLNFSDEQLMAINHISGPALVIAGPGSGKTATTVVRIKNMIENHGINPESILSITFSKKAAMQMQSRFNNLCKDTFYPVQFGTFHSIFFSILRNAHMYKSDSIIRLSEERSILKRILINYSNIYFFENEYIDSILKRISYYKNTNINSTCFEDGISSEDFLQIFKEYQEALKSVGKLDFDDICIECKELLKNNVELRQYYQKRIQYILVDEFQDINKEQFEVLQLLLNKKNNLYCVGDDDQAIYKFRGADNSYMRNFKHIMPDAKLYYLSCNYRSTGNIIKISSILISENSDRYNKRIITRNVSGEQVDIYRYDSEKIELENICNYIKDTVWNNVALLFRNNSELIQYSQYLKSVGVKCFSNESTNTIYENETFKTFLRYVKIAKSEVLTASDFIYVMNRPVRYLNVKYINGEYVNLEALEHIYAGKEYVVKAIKKFRYDINNIKTMNMYDAYEYLRKIIGYDKYIYNKYGENIELYKKQLSILEEIGNIIKENNEYELLNALAEFNNSKVEEKMEYEGKGVFLLTYHASKGLEFDTVIIPGLNEGYMPSNKAIELQDIEEERRLLYVAMTRAKKKLILSYNGNFKSRFLYGICKENKRV